MMSANVVSKVILVKGVLNALLGVVHVVVAFAYESAKIAGQGTAEMQRDYLVWFSVVGVFILFMGLVDILCYRGLRSSMSWAWRMSLLCVVFTTLTGAAGVAVFGPSPPLQLLATGLVGLIVLTLSRREFHSGVS